jgi:hypothetical protein
LTGEFPIERPLARAALSAVEAALDRDPALAGIAFTVVPVGRGHVELQSGGCDARGACPRLSGRDRRRARDRSDQSSLRSSEDDLEQAAESDALSPRMSEPLPPQYNPAETERALYEWWQARGWRNEPPRIVTRTWS